MVAFALALMLQDIEKPHRVAIERLNLSIGKDEAVTCISRTMSAWGIVNTIPVRGGVEIDFTFKGMPFAAPGDPLMTVWVKSDAAGLFISSLYRHPISAKSMIGASRDLAKKCFRDDWNLWAKDNNAKPID